MLFTLIALIRRNHWSFRIFEFRRFQKWVINVAILMAYLTVSSLAASIDWWMEALLCIKLRVFEFSDLSLFTLCSQSNTIFSFVGY